MKIVLITNGNAASALALGTFLERHAKSVEAILVTKKLPSSKNNVSGVLKMLRVSGIEYTWFKIWINVIAPLVLRLQNRCASVEEVARRYNTDVKVRKFNSVNGQEGLSFIKAADPDIIISFSATQRFSNEVIDSSKVATINVHYGALPAYAGLSPYYWHLRNGEKEFGVTLHVIDSGLDSGPIIRQVRRDMTQHRDALSVLQAMAAEVSPLLCDFLENGCSIENTQVQDSSGRTYFGHPSKEDRREFRRSGFSMRTKNSIKKFLSSFPGKR